MKKFLAVLALVGLFSTPVMAEADVRGGYDDTEVIVGAAALTAGGLYATQGAVAVSASTAAIAGGAYFLAWDMITRGNDSFWAQAVMGLCSALGGEQSPEDNYQTCN